MGRKRIYPSKNNAWKDEDRMNIAIALLKGGYSVRIASEKQGSRTVYFIEYWEEE